MIIIPYHTQMLYPKKMSCKNYGLAINYDNETNIIPKKKISGRDFDVSFHFWVEAPGMDRWNSEGHWGTMSSLGHNWHGWIHHSLSDLTPRTSDDTIIFLRTLSCSNSTSMIVPGKIVQYNIHTYIYIHIIYIHNIYIYRMYTYTYIYNDI